MSTLIRSDGAVFLIQVYRDQLKQQKPKQMRESLRRLSAQQGRYLRIFSDKKGVLEVCLDKDVGFLLGESIARNFNKHPDFIYIENREKLEKSVIIVVRNEKVQLDTLVPTNEIWSELLPLVASETQYDLFYSGFENQLPGEFFNNGFGSASIAKMMERAVSLPQSLIDSLPLDLDLQLLPYEKALENSPLSGLSKGIWVAISGVCLVVFLLIMVVIAKPQESRTQVGLSPYAGYYQGLSEQPASQVLGSVIRVLSQVFLLPAIELQRVEYHDHQLALSFMDQQPNLSPLLSFAKDNQFEFLLYSSRVKLTQQQHVKPVKIENKIYSTTQLYVYLSDHLRRIHPGSSFHFLSSKQGNHWKVWSCEWRVSDLTSADLDWLRRILVNAPVSCDGISLAYHDGVMQGTIHLKIWGT
jgi:hypothetical protein